MPLIVICGLPASGKTRRARELQAWLEADGRTVHLINDEALGIDRRIAYADPNEEKKARGAMQAAVERVLSKKDVVIADGLNYIKGFRYQLHCIAKALGTPQCVVECAATQEQRTAWNAERPDGYPSTLVEELVTRYEAPSSMNRWDRPLFVLTAEDPLPRDAIAAAVFQGKAPNPNLATRPVPLADTNYVFELDRITLSVLQQIQEAQRLAPGPGRVVIPGASQPILLSRTVTPSELQRHRQQFIHVNKLNALKSVANLTDLFVQYLNTCVRND